MNMRSLLAFACGPVLLTACSAPSTVTPTISAPTTARRATSSWHLYIANGNNTVTVYDPGGTTPVETISQNISRPQKIRFGRTGSVYVLNCRLCSTTGGGSVTVYGAHNYPYLRTISDGVNYPTDIALDGAGNLYVANESSNTVTVYPPGGTKVARTITNGIARPRALAIDGSDRVYVANCLNACDESYTGTVTVYDGHTDKLLETISGLEIVGPMVIGPNGDLYAVIAGDSSEPSYVGVFPWGSLKPVLKLSSEIYGLSVAVDSIGNTYVAECGPECLYSIQDGDGFIQEYGPKGYPILRIHRGGDIAVALTVGLDGDLYAAYYLRGVLGFAPGSKKPSIKIKKGVIFPADIEAGP
jgi:YVTN family beta-propeller protein